MCSLISIITRRAMAEMETEDDKFVKPQDAMDMDIEGIAVESNAMAPDPEVGPEHAGGGPDAMKMDVTADVGGDGQLAAIQPDEGDL